MGAGGYNRHSRHGLQSRRELFRSTAIGGLFRVGASAARRIQMIQQLRIACHAATSARTVRVSMFPPSHEHLCACWCCYDGHKLSPQLVAKRKLFCFKTAFSRLYTDVKPSRPFILPDVVILLDVQDRSHGKCLSCQGSPAWFPCLEFLLALF
jgi:hypothetical protein